MKTLKKVKIEPVFVEYLPFILEENKIYISEVFKTASHLCLCGCGNRTVTPIGGDRWNIIKESESTISLIGSIGNFQFPCNSHYIITKNVANFI